MVSATHEFGSAEVLDLWLDRFRLSHAITGGCGRPSVINLYGETSDLPWEISVEEPPRENSSICYTLYDGRGSNAITRLQSGDLIARKTHVPCHSFSGTIWSSWAAVKLREPPTVKETREAFTWDDQESTCDPLPLTETTSEIIGSTPELCSTPVSITSPVYTTPSRICSICQSSLISTRSVVDPPGFCEYSGQMICGNCFHNRQVVVPWKLINGLESFRGNVSRQSAQIIHSNFYQLCIQYSQLSHLPLVRSVQAMRIRCQTFREKIASCSDLRLSLSSVISPLPAHFRDELISLNQSESCCLAYCLADLVDIVGGSSIIGRTFLSCLNVLEAHKCQPCESRYTKICVLCSRPVSSTDIEWTYCDECRTWYHRSCHARCIGGCPVCANQQSYCNFSIEDFSDLVVSS